MSEGGLFQQFIVSISIPYINSEKRFDVIMEYMSSGKYPAYKMIKPLCHVYDLEKIISKYDYTLGVKQTQEKHNNDLKKYLDKLHTGEHKYNISTEVYFDEFTHFYCERKRIDAISSVYRYFDDFDSLISYRNGNLSKTDLSKAIKLKYNFPSCWTDYTTILPVSAYDKLKYKVVKKYEIKESYYQNKKKFIVNQEWYYPDDIDILVKQRKHEFDYFFDFVHFLKFDLSGADLLLCDELENLNDWSNLNFTDSKLTSKLCDKFGISYDKYVLHDDLTESFPVTEKYEIESFPELQISREGINSSRDFNNYQISYITDLHLVHKLINNNVRSYSDVVYIIKKIAKRIISESSTFILIGGDVSSDFSLFELFVKELRNEMKKQNCFKIVIFVLGNHELWEFQELSFDNIVEKYRAVIEKHDMYLLQNNILFIEREYAYFSPVDIKCISTSEIIKDDIEELHEKLKKARMILFGGLGFSGYDNDFNADAGIYRSTIDRIEEINQTTKFEKLYNKVSNALINNKPIIFTHTPIECWRKEVDYCKNFIYVNGHTHRNYFYDDGEIRVYADNQIGYKNNSPHMKSFEMNSGYEYFSDYPDGIYTITKEDYYNFYHGKNIFLNYNYNNDSFILHMLKKHGYYCFIRESTVNYTILNGGSPTKLPKKDIKYFYDKMDEVIANIEEPLTKFTKIQKKISAEIKKIGGSGNIHGSIIDIDWYNHIYVNPIDLKITGYWASDIKNKIVYPDIPTLLEKNCPEMYARYLKLLSDKSSSLPSLSKKRDNAVSVLPQEYLSTDIYKVSREIKKMQKLEAKILTTWIETKNGTKMIK